MNPMNPDTPIFVSGGRGLAGSAVVRELLARGYQRVLRPAHAELDLEDSAATQAWFDRHQPQVVVHAAGKVGGILANNTYPVDFLVRNLDMATNVLRAANETGVQRLLFLGSSCIYPRDCPQPIREEFLLTGPLEPTNRPYALAKIAGIEQCWAYNRQHGRRFLAAMPTNLYGPGDNYDLASSHVLPALLRKIHEAQAAGAAEVVLWGSGSPQREFLHVDDLARGLLFLLDLDEAAFARLTAPEVCPLINVGTGDEITIRGLAELIAETVGYRGRFVHDTSKPDGTPRKVMDVSRIRALGWAPAISLAEGVKRTCEEYRALVRVA